jgi:hypothetical protein
MSVCVYEYKEGISRPDRLTDRYMNRHIEIDGQTARQDKLYRWKDGKMTNRLI